MWTTIVVSSILLMTVFGSVLSETNDDPLTNIKPLISHFKGDVHRILEGVRIKKKRQLEDSDSLSYKLKIGRADHEDLPYLSSLNITFWISVHEKQANQLLIGTTEGRLRLFQLSDESDKLASEVAQSKLVDFPVNAKAFSSNDEQWFAVLHYSDQGYYIQMYRRDGRGLEEKQKIDLSGLSDIELVTMKGIHYLVVASYTSKIGQSSSYQSTVTLYFWAQSQFDSIASRSVYGARSVVCWILDGSLYVAVAQEVDDEGKMEIGSPIFLYNSKEENRLVLWEYLQTLGPRKIQHFSVANNHYLVVIGRQDAVIYWWSSGQFLKWQTLDHTAEATDVSVIDLGNGEVAIVLALQGQALFYTLDSSGLYIITWSLRLGGTNLRSLQLMFSGKSYYALALFEDDQDYYRKTIYRLTIDSHYLPTVQSLDQFQECLHDLKQLLKERQDELDIIKTDLGRVWLKGSNQTITSKVIIEGSILSNKPSQVRDVIIVRYANIPDVPMSLVIAALVEVNDLAHNAKSDVEGAVTKSTRQEIRGTNHFNESVYVPSLTMESSPHDLTINGVPISRLQNYVLRKTGDQVFSAMTSVSNFHSEAAEVASLNGILIDDQLRKTADSYTNLNKFSTTSNVTVESATTKFNFLLLHGVQTVLGHLTFSSVSITDAFVEHLNSISIDDIITTNVPQNIENLKTFISLKANYVDVSGETNELDLSSIRNKIATTGKYNEFGGQLTFSRPLTIDGDMLLTLKINRIVDLETLVQKSVKRDTEQDLAGQYTFKGKQVINGDLWISGLINGVSLDNLLTLSSDQKIYADVTFLQPIAVERDLIVGEVNSVDLSEAVLRKSLPHQFVTGRKTFAKTMQADFVDMTDYITLDGVDPSFLVQDIVQHRQGVIEHNTTVLKDVEVLNTLTVIGDLNGINIVDLSSSVWLKSTEQPITSNVTIRYLHCKRDVDVFTVNGLNLELDFVHTLLDETIEAEKTFTLKTVTKSLYTNGAINGIDLKSYKIELAKYRNEWEIQGSKSITSLGVNGNLQVTKLNQLDVSDIMRPDAEQTVFGPVELSEISFIRGSADIQTMSTPVFNGLDLQDFFRNAILASQAYKPVMNKHFNHLKASSMTIPTSSKIAGVSLDELLQRVVTLRDPQLITASKIFATSLKFNKLINTDRVNGLKLNDYLNEVVLTDEISKINNKFLGNIEAEKVSVSGLINGIKIEDLAANVFYKSEENVVKEHFIVEGDIDVGNVFAPTVNGIPWSDLIFLQEAEALEDGWFLSKTRVEGDIFVTGPVNGCDLSQISSVLYTNKSTQVIKKNLNVRNIVVVGNLIVKKTVNDISLEDLKNLITISDRQTISSDAIIDASLIADQLHLSNIGNENLVFIMQDAVRNSVPQEINGQKTFIEGIDIPILTTGDLLASIVNGVDLEELETTTVWKNGYQEIAGDKILPSLLVNVAIVNGYLNGLKLPEDVIRADVSEHISHPTYLMSDVYISTDVIVYGHIDSVNLNILINRRITLNSDQNFTSYLTFKDDVILYDHLIIDGTINDIVLELVATSKPPTSYPIQGYKMFREFHATGSVTAFSVNQFDLVKLSNSILQYNRNEHIKEIQIFEKPVHVHNSVFVEWVNNVPIRQLTTAFSTMMNGLQSVLGYLQDLSNTLQQQLNLMMSASQDQVYKYAYFTLFQEIDAGPTSRILYGYSIESSDHKFSHSLILWNQQKHCIFMGKCCHVEFSYTLQVMKSGIVMMDSSAAPGRYYPIPNLLPTVSEKQFFIWTNSTVIQSEWCTDKIGRMTLAGNNGDLLEVYIDIESDALVSEVKSFRKRNLYAVASFYYNPKNDEYGSTVVYTYNERYWSEHQSLPSFGILSLDLITYSQGYREDVLLALGTGMKTEPASNSAVYKWNSDTSTFELLQNIPSQYVSSTLWIQKGRDLLLSMASVDHWPIKSIDCGELVSGGQIDVFSYKEHYLEWIQSIPVEGVVSMVSFSVDGNTYLAAASIQYQTIYIFEWRGFSGFVQIQTISAEARHLNTYRIDDDLYMTVASASGPSKILKLVRKGKSSKSPRNFDLITSEQQDETAKPADKGCLL